MFEYTSLTKIVRYKQSSRVSIDCSVLGFWIIANKNFIYCTEVLDLECFMKIKYD